MKFQPILSKTQTDLILDHLAKKQSISGLEAGALYSIRSLTRRICDLQAEGHRFSKQHCVDPRGQRYVRYHYLGFQGLPASAA
jgi:hypothetical protein